MVVFNGGEGPQPQPIPESSFYSYLLEPDPQAEPEAEPQPDAQADPQPDPQADPLQPPANWKHMNGESTVSISKNSLISIFFFFLSGCDFLYRQ